MSPAEKEARQMMADKKAQDAATKAYNAADKTPSAPAVKKARGGSIKGMHRMPDGSMMKDSAHMGMKAGGSASKRADGIAAKGKTRGKMV